MRDLHATEPAFGKPEIDPEQLLKLLDLQLVAQRGKRHEHSNRTAFRVGALVLIVVMTVVALLMLQWMMPPAPPRSAPSAKVSEAAR